MMRWPMKRGAFDFGPNLVTLFPPERRSPNLLFFAGMVEYLRERGVDPFGCWFTFDSCLGLTLHYELPPRRDDLAQKYADQMRAWPA